MPQYLVDVEKKLSMITTVLVEAIDETQAKIIAIGRIERGGWPERVSQQVSVMSCEEVLHDRD